MYAWINGLANNRWAGDVRRHRAHYDVAVINSHNKDAVITWKPFNDIFINAFHMYVQMYVLWDGYVWEVC